MSLYNKLSKEQLKSQLEKENFTRTTLSFYRYIEIKDTEMFRNKLYRKFSELNCLGRIYIAKEGINAQMSIPEHRKEELHKYLESVKELENMPIKWALDNQSDSFYKLIIKQRNKIVADGLDDKKFDVTNVGNHLSPEEFHELIDSEGSIVIDMRNHYESEIGHFEKAICPDVDTFREEVLLVEKALEIHKDKKLLLYCTGGVRCEKASAYFKHKGFSDVNQLHGGIIAYAQRINELGLKSKFRGKNFVFDNRLGESINHEIISKCHQCGDACDTHTNCENNDCHLLFIQCKSCKEKYKGCCTEECTNIIMLPEEEQIKLKSIFNKKLSKSKSYQQRIRPHLN